MNQRQEIDLYLPELRKQTDYLSTQRIIIGIGIFLFILASFQLNVWLQVQEIEYQLLAAEKQQQQVRQSVVELRQRKPQSKKNTVAQKLVALQQQIELSRRISDVIVGQNLGNTHGFSEQLRSMARQSHDQLSLAEFKLLEGGNYVEFKGLASRADVIPHYLQSLREEDSFTTVRFGVLSIEQDENNPRHMRFSLVQPAVTSSSVIPARTAFFRQENGL